MWTWSLPPLVAFAFVVLEILVVLRRGVALARPYFVLLLANLGGLLWVIGNERYLRAGGGPSGELIAATGATVLLVLVPSLLERLGARARQVEKFDVAARLAGLRELLVPGRASSAEREFYEQIAKARSGRVDEVLHALRAQLVESEPPDDALIQERIVAMLLFAGRHQDALTQFETHLGGEPARFPGVAVQMVRALGELGEIERAAELVTQLEQSVNPQDPAAQQILLPARLHLLSFAGARRAVERLLGLDALKRLVGKKVREVFIARAREYEARAAEPRPEALARYLEAVAERAAIDARVSAAVPMRAFPPATTALVLANLAAFVAFAFLLGDAESIDHLVRGGADIHLAVRAGESWRLFTSLLVHGNALHLFFNLYGLYLIGRIVEPVYGWARFTIIYFAAGLAGSVASGWNPNPHASIYIGAGSAVLGVLAALMVLLIARRDVWPERWRKNLMINLALLLGVQLMIGDWMEVVDNFAHLGGIVGGAMVAGLLLPGGFVGRRALRVLVPLALAALASVAAWSSRSLVGERIDGTLARLPRDRFSVGRVSLELFRGTEKVKAEKADWPGEELLVDPLSGLRVGPYFAAAVAPGAHAPSEVIGDVLGAAMKSDVARIAQAASAENQPATVEEARAPAMPGWTAMAQAHPGADGFTILYYARQEGGAVLVVKVVWHGDLAAARVITDEIRRALESLRIDPAPSPVASPAPAPQPPPPAPPLLPAPAP